MARSSPHSIFAKVGSYARAHGLLRPGPLVVAVSGGTDSVALALILAELREELGLVLHVAHFDHRARPRTAAADAAFVADLANHIGASLRVGRADERPSSEDDARRARYAFLRRVAKEIGATGIATGHTKDDQAETVLLHLARGSGLEGLAGMRPERDGVVRPLLPLTRAQTKAICKAARIRPREDPTNRALRFARNRVRLRVLPELKKLNPEVVDAIARLADAAATVAETKRAAASAAVEVAADQGAIDLARLPAISTEREHVLAVWWEQRTGRRLASRQRAALDLLAASADGSKSIDLPGGRALREYGILRFVSAGAAPVPNGPVALERGHVADWHGWRLALDTVLEGDGAKETAAFSEDAAVRLVVRSRRPGDRLSGPRGAKLQDLFTNAKVPARQRDDWPVVAVGERIVWLPGITPAPKGGGVALEVLRIVEERSKSARG